MIVSRSAITAALPAASEFFVGSLDQPEDSTLSNEVSAFETNRHGHERTDWGALPLVPHVLRSSADHGASLGTQPLLQRKLTSDLLKASEGSIQTSSTASSLAGGSAFRADPFARPSADGRLMNANGFVDGNSVSLQRTEADLLSWSPATTSPLSRNDSLPDAALPVVQATNRSTAPQLTQGVPGLAPTAIARSLAPLDLLQQPRAALQQAEETGSQLATQAAATASNVGQQITGQGQQDIEKIAREVYSHLRRRLLIEHERRGRNI
jgi:hypothetical protein